MRGVHRIPICRAKGDSVHRPHGDAGIAAAIGSASFNATQDKESAAGGCAVDGDASRITRERRARRLLSTGADNDPQVREEVINTFFVHNDAKDLVELARKESDPAMKRRIVERLSIMRNSKDATDYMMELLK